MNPTNAETFKVTRIIKPDNLALPKEGTIGYGRIEKVYYDGPKVEVKPQIFEDAKYEELKLER